jgi:hypothetical protein
VGLVIFVAAVTGGRALLYRLKIRHQTGVLPEHAAAEPPIRRRARPAGNVN